ncbi:DUF5074 domain-containing protein [Natronogracilivirga saccharolytica]|uniref:T9SS type A sorting domain-containing protein n=1 Tax=Natronogracilivirga saccharolytica TaxID=2812953 RepID=A0A8J7RLR4_9BACT|nr:DUF5074 domain-containing protein [Natronogracilivirga saccharolytica]MBP3193200.1 T9SS type A sorting domain-containing protein [Natronogracilivirga saccharolytica]
MKYLNTATSNFYSWRKNGAFCRGMLLLIILLAYVWAPGNAEAQPERVFVLNEGAFGQGNASLTVYEPETGQAVNNVFFNENDRPLGDVGNHAAIIDDKLYIVVNNSQKIEVVDPETYQSLGTINIDTGEHDGSPRQIAGIGDRKAYVTNLYGDNVSIIDLDLMEETGQIDAGPGPEGIVVAEGYAFVALSGLGLGNEVAVIDIQNHELVKTLEVGDNPVHITRSPDGMIWSVGTGNFGFDENQEFDPEYETFGEIVIIDPVSLEVTDRLETGGHPGKLTFPDENFGLLHLDGLQKVDVVSPALNEEPFLERSLHAFDVAAGGDDRFQLYVTTAPDFSSSGKVIRYDDQGSPVDSFQAGIGPKSMAFRDGKATRSESEREIVDKVTLEQNYPNPFNSSTTIRFFLPESAVAKLEVFDILGRSVAVLVNKKLQSGEHQVQWDASGVSSGVFLYRLTAGEVKRSGRMLHVK